MAAHILVIEDDEGSRQMLVAVLERAGFAVTALADGRRVVQILDADAPDLVVLDLRLGDGPDGHSLAKTIRAADVPVMFLSATAELEERLTAFEEGSEDYLVKPVSVAELLARIEAVLRRTLSDRHRSSIEIRDLVIDLAARKVRRAGEDLHLTKTEFGLLAELVRRQGRVLSKTELLDRVWGYTEFDVNVVEVAVSSLRRKLESDNAPRLVQTVRGAGYIVRA